MCFLIGCRWRSHKLLLKCESELLPETGHNNRRNSEEICEDEAQKKNNKEDHLDKSISRWQRLILPLPCVQAVIGQLLSVSVLQKLSLANVRQLIPFVWNCSKWNNHQWRLCTPSLNFFWNILFSFYLLVGPRFNKHNLDYNQVIAVASSNHMMHWNTTGLLVLPHQNHICTPLSSWVPQSLIPSHRLLVCSQEYH